MTPLTLNQVKLFRTLNDALQGFAVYDDAFRN